MTDAAAAPTGDSGRPDPPPPPNGMRTFTHVLINTAVANLTTSFVWFALTFWVYLETRSVLATGVIGGAYMLLVALFSMFFGTLVDRFRKHAVMVWATVGTSATFLAAGAMYLTLPESELLRLTGPWFWLFIVIVLAGSVVEQLRSIALSTTVTLLVPGPRRANANGAVGTVQGLAFIVTSALSGLSVGLLGMGVTLLIGNALVLATLVHLLVLRIPEPEIVAGEGATGWVDIRGGWAAVRAAPGLTALVIFATLNNLVGGVYMALMDPYGIEVFGGAEAWGIALAIASCGFLVGGGLVAKLGLGRRPIRLMLVLAAVVGVLGATFALREHWWLYGAGVFLFMVMMPVIEASEQTVLQRVVPFRQQGRVFGFAMTFEAAAAPITAFVVSPIAEFWVIPYMRTDDGAATWGWLLGDGEVRGIALVFLISGIAAILLVAGAFLTKSYRMLSAQYSEAAAADEAAGSVAPPEPAAPDEPGAAGASAPRPLD